MTRDAQVRFYFDADILGVAKLVAGLRSDVTYPGDPGATIKRKRRPASPVTSPATKDTVWIPEIAARGWLAITRDSNIAGHRREVAAVTEFGAKLVVLASDEATSPWSQLEIVMTQWRQLETLHSRPGPFIIALSRTSVRDVDLSG